MHNKQVKHKLINLLRERERDREKEKTENHRNNNFHCGNIRL